MRNKGGGTKRACYKQSSVVGKTGNDKDKPTSFFTILFVMQAPLESSAIAQSSILSLSCNIRYPEDATTDPKDLSKPYGTLRIPKVG